MAIEPHLMDGEDVLEYCTTDYWSWVCTDQRVVKYKQGSNAAEQLHDISFSEISGISLVSRGKNDRTGIGGILSLILGFVMVASAIQLFVLLGFILFLLGIYLMYRWWTSEASYFEFKGGGLIQSEPEQWRINDEAADDSDSVREFVKTVRSQL